jgi:GNAT superfamily N-acetyltransferase
VAAIRRCRDDERRAILAIVNAAAEAYRDVIPADRWRDPYMPREEFDSEIAAGVDFWGYEDTRGLVGVMGIQPVRYVDLIRHAYVVPGSQRGGIGGALLEHLMDGRTRRVLVGTWAAAEWAIRFYERHGFEHVGGERTAALLEQYWTIPERQVETSFVLAADRSVAVDRPERALALSRDRSSELTPAPPATRVSRRMVAVAQRVRPSGLRGSPHGPELPGG